MNNLLFVITGGCCIAAGICLLVVCCDLSHRIHKLEQEIVKMKDDIINLHMRKANKKPGFEVTIPPNMAKDYAEVKLLKEVGDYLARKKHPL